TLTSLDRPDLKEETWTPTTQPRLRGIAAEVPDLFAVLRAGDILAHHPYDSFATSVEAFTDHASSDPELRAMKHTLYPTPKPPPRSHLRGREPSFVGLRPWRGRHRAVQPAHRLQPAEPLPQAARRADKPAPGNHAAHRARGRRGRASHHQGQQPDRPGDHRRALRRVSVWRADRSPRSQHVLAASRCAGALGTDPRPLDRR